MKHYERKVAFQANSRLRFSIAVRAHIALAVDSAQTALGFVTNPSGCKLRKVVAAIRFSVGQRFDLRRASSVRVYTFPQVHKLAIGQKAKRLGKLRVA